MIPEDEAQGKRRRAVSEILDEDVEYCDKCGVDTEGANTKTISIETGEVRRQLCHRCDDIETVERYEATGELTSRLLLMANVQRDPGGALLRVKESYGRLLERVGAFERRVWLAGLWKAVWEARSGLSMRVEGGEMLLLATGGRALVTMQRGDRDLTLITADGEPEKVGSRMGIQGVHATEDAAAEILEFFTVAWESGRRPVPDGNVSV